MSNRNLIILTIVILGGLAFLVAINMANLVLGQSPNQQFVKYNDVRGMAVKHDGAIYTLNFEQQNKMISMLNLSTALDKVDVPQPFPLPIKEIVIYPFEKGADITLTPVALSDSDLVFSVPAWVPGGQHLFMELSEGDMPQLLAQTYD